MNKGQIKEVILEQREEIARVGHEIAVEREKEAEAGRYLKTGLVKVIIGARRSGKSFLAHRILKGKNYGYVNFDDERLIDVKTEDLNDFLETIKETNPECEYLFFDEIQNVAGWELFANRLKRTGYNLIITGSNANLLSRELATHLTGRHATFELYPFSFREFLKRKKISVEKNEIYLTKKRALLKRELENYLEQGGFPELFSVDDKKQYLRDLYGKIIDRDIMPRHKVRYGKCLKEISLYLFSNFGSSFSYQKLKNIFAVKSVHTIKNYISYLEEAYLVFELAPYSHKFKVQATYAKKAYVIDTGLIRAVAFQNSYNKGRLMENAVFLDLKRKKKEIYYYSSRTGQETDFVVRDGGKIKELIQVCYDLDNIETRERETKALLKAGAELRCANLLIITWDEEKEEKIKGKTITYLPLWKWLLENK